MFIVLLNKVLEFLQSLFLGPKWGLLLQPLGTATCQNL